MRRGGGVDLGPGVAATRYASCFGDAMNPVVNAAISILFDGLAYGMLLFIISVGLSITMGLMGFINLAHGAFAMFGGYVTVSLMNNLGVPFIPALGLAFVIIAVVSVPIERLVYRPLYRAGELHS